MENDIVLMIVIYGTIFALLLCIFIVKVMNKKNTTNNSNNFSPEDFPNELDQTMIYHLAFCKDNSTRPVTNYKNIFSSIILNLARKGYIEISKIDEQKPNSFSNIKIIEKSFEAQLSTGLLVSNNFTDLDVTKDAEHLTLTERYCYELIMRYTQKNEVFLKTLYSKISEDSNSANEFSENIKETLHNIGTSQGYFQNDNSFELTQVGKRDHLKYQKLYNFLNSDKLEKSHTTIEIALAEKYLIYATLFGISGKVLKALKERCPDYKNSIILSNSIYNSNTLLDVIKPFIVAMK